MTAVEPPGAEVTPEALQHRELWRRSCLYGDLDQIQRLWALGTIDRETRVQGWEDAYACGNHEVGVWIASQDRDGLPIDRKFQDICRVGRIDGAQSLLSLAADLHQDHDRAWRRACARGDLEMAQWLWDQGGIDHHALGDWAWRAACIHGHLDVARWIWDLGGVDVGARNHQVWHMVCPVGDGTRQRILPSHLWLQYARDGPDEIYLAKLCRRGGGWISHAGFRNHKLIIWLLGLGIPRELAEQSWAASPHDLAEIIDQYAGSRRAKSARSAVLPP